MTQSTPNPLISVVCAVHNGMPWLRESVASILTQTDADFELILIDDASTDATAHYLATLTDPRITLTTLATNHGLTAALLHGLTLARGAYIARIDADDIALPHRLARQAADLDANPDVLLVAGQHIEFMGTPPPSNAAQLADAIPDEEITFARLLKKNVLCHSAVMFRRAMIAEGLTYRPAFRQGQDYDLWLRVALAGRIIKRGETVCLYRRRAEAISLTHIEAQLRFVQHARTLAKMRQTTATDTLDSTGEFPPLAPEETQYLRQRTLETLFHFMRKSWGADEYAAALRLCVRGFLRQPLRFSRLWLGHCCGGDT